MSFRLTFYGRERKLRVQREPPNNRLFRHRRRSNDLLLARSYLLSSLSAPLFFKTQFIAYGTRTRTPSAIRRVLSGELTRNQYCCLCLSRCGWRVRTSPTGNFAARCSHLSKARSSKSSSPNRSCCSCFSSKQYQLPAGFSWKKSCELCLSSAEFAFFSRFGGQIAVRSAPGAAAPSNPAPAPAAPGRRTTGV